MARTDKARCLTSTGSFCQDDFGTRFLIQNGSRSFFTLAQNANLICKITPDTLWIGNSLFMTLHDFQVKYTPFSSKTRGAFSIHLAQQLSPVKTSCLLSRAQLTLLVKVHPYLYLLNPNNFKWFTGDFYSDLSISNRTMNVIVITESKLAFIYRRHVVPLQSNGHLGHGAMKELYHFKGGCLPWDG